MQPRYHSGGSCPEIPGGATFFCPQLYTIDWMAELKAQIDSKDQGLAFGCFAISLISILEMIVRF